MKKVEEIDGKHTILVDIHFAPTLQLQGKCIEIYSVYQDPNSSPIERNEHVCMLNDILVASAQSGCDANVLLISYCCCALLLFVLHVSHLPNCEDPLPLLYRPNCKGRM